MLQKIKVIVITYSWPPKNSIATHRPYTWAKYLSQKNIDLTVLTTKKYDYDAPLDLEVLKLDNVKVIEVDYLKKNNMVFKWILRKMNLSTLKKIYRVFKKNTHVNLNPRQNWRKECKNYIDILSKDTDVVISTYDPAECHLIAYDIKKKNNKIFWIADYRDMWSLNHVAELSDLNRQKLMQLEKETVGKYADACITVSKFLSESLTNLLNKKVFIIENGFDLHEEEVASNLEKNKNKNKNKISIVYTGRIYPKFQNPKPILDALVEMKANKELENIDIKINYYGLNSDVFNLLKKNKDYSEFINICGYIDRDSILEIQKSSDLLLLLESDLPIAKGVLTGKLFEYISSGVPILSLGSLEDSAIAEVLNSTATGVCCGENKNKIKTVIRGLVSEQDLDWFKPNINNIMNFSRKKQAERVYEIILDGLKKS